MAYSPLGAKIQTPDQILNSTQVAAIFLDSGLHIRSFTPAAAAVFRLIAGDAGRPLTDLAAQFVGEGTLVEDVKEVLRTLSVRERELTGAHGRYFLFVSEGIPVTTIFYDPAIGWYGFSTRFPGRHSHHSIRGR